MDDRKKITTSEADKITVICADCQQETLEYESSEIGNLIQGGEHSRVCPDCYQKNWRSCLLCEESIRITSYNPTNNGEFEVNAIWRDSEILDDGTYLDYMCHDCCQKLMPALNFFIGADKEMLRKCRELCRE